MTTRTHPFRAKKTAGSIWERFVFVLLGLFTYVILGFGLLIFGIIVYRGAPTVFNAFRVDGHLPFVHNDFLFTKPQTLHVFKYDGKVMQLPADQFNKLTGAGTNPVPAATPAAAPMAPQAAPTANAPTVPPEKPVFQIKGMKTEITVIEGQNIVVHGTMIKSGTNAAPAAPTVTAPAIDPEKITDHVSYSYAAGGIWPQIVGTVLLVIGSMAIALVLGVFSAIYLSEYSKQGPIINAIRLAILNLAGVPSIVFGLFGVSLFVLAFHWNISMLAGWFTLAFMVLPVIITASEESLRAVPQGFREGSLALGATKWQTIWQNVLPYALPGILTSSVLGVARVAGETAPILFTAAYALSDKLPWDDTTSGEHFTPGLLGYLQFPFVWLRDFVLHPVNALPYHIYVVSTKIPQNEYSERVQYGTAFVFLVVVMSIALASVLLRLRLRSRLKW